MSANLPINWADKKNSPVLADFIAKYGSQYCMTAEEINQLRNAVNEMALIQQSIFLGAAEPAFTPAGTGRAYWLAVKPGTYANHGGVVVGANEIAFIIRDDVGVFSISKTELNLSDYAKKIDFKLINKTAIPELLGNLIDVNNPDNLVDSSMDGTGELVSGYPGAVISYQILVDEGKSYIYGGLSGNTAIRYENENGIKIGYEIALANIRKEIIIPAGCRFVRVMSRITSAGDIAKFGKKYFEYQESQIVYKDDVIATENYFNLFGNNLIQKNSKMNIINYSLDGNGELSYFNGGITTHKIPNNTTNLLLINNSKNLQNKSLDGSGGIADWEDGIVSFSMPFKENTEYIYDAYAYNLSIRFEDINGDLISNHLTESVKPYRNTSPAGTHFVRVNIKLRAIPQNPNIYFGVDYFDYGSPTYVYTSKNTNNKAIRYEDENGNKIGYQLTSGISQYYFTPVNGTKFFRIGGYVEGDFVKENKIKTFDYLPFQGKKVALYGDSITVDYDSAIYQRKIKQLLKPSSISRFGQSGGQFAYTLQTSTFLNPLISYNPDLVIIHSVNSHRANNPKGTMDSLAGEASEIGGLKTIFDALISNNKNVKIVFCTPLCYGDVIPLGFPDSFGSTSPNGIGLYLTDYIKGQIELCRLYGINIVHLTEKCGFRDKVESDVNERVYTLDGVHPNSVGYNVMTQIIADVVNNLFS